MEWAERIGRRLKLRDLHLLITVVQRGSMAKAAAELGVSQPAVSKRSCVMRPLMSRARTRCAFRLM